MIIGKVAGNVYSSNKTKYLEGTKLLIVKQISPKTLNETGEYFVCVDDVGAGEGEIVFCASGSGARQTKTSKEHSSDYTICGIIDNIDIENIKTYEK